jgi:pyrroloquinoline quinone biosynthesis protein B
MRQLGKIDDQIMQIMQDSDCVMIDGTLWTDDEMQQTGVGKKLAVKWGIYTLVVKAVRYLT